MIIVARTARPVIPYDTNSERKKADGIECASQPKLTVVNVKAAGDTMG